MKERIALIFCFLLVISNYIIIPAHATSGDGCVLYLPFNEGSGTTAYDLSGYGNNGTITEALWTTGKYGQALSFDGINDTVATPLVGLMSSFTITFWIYPTNFTAWVIFMISQGYIATGVALPYFNVWTTDANTAVYADAALPLNSWAFITATCDWNGTLTTLKLYENASFAGVPATYTKPASGIGSAISLGSNTATFPFKGDELRVFNRVLSASEILFLYELNEIPATYESNTLFALGALALILALAGIALFAIVKHH